MSKPRFRAFSDKILDSALLNLRAQIIRDGKPGLEHVEALLALRGHEPPPVPVKNRRSFRRGELKRIVLGALRDGPVTTRGVASRVQTHAPHLDDTAAYNAAWDVCRKFRAAGVVERSGDHWYLCVS